jgi:uncharacterized protein (DUF58 family)
MKKGTVLFYFTLLSLSVIYAQKGPVFSVEVSNDSILMGNMVKVAFTLENAQGDNFQAPYFKEFDVVSGPNVSTSFSMINGQTSQTITYTYYLRPREIGNYFIEPASISTEEAVLETQPLEVIVVPNPDGLIQEPEPQTDPFNNRMEPFSWPDFPSFDKAPSPSQPKKKEPKKRKTYKM